jgi:DNA-binding IclR family transcriptional regulator
MSIQSIERVGSILSLFSAQKPRWGNAEIASAVGLAKTTVSTILRTMVKIGFLSQDPETRRYTLGYRLFTLGMIAGDTLEINQKAQGPAQNLAERTGLICRVGIWDRDAVVTTLNIVPRDVEFLARQIGPRVVAYLHAEDIEDYLKKTRMTPFTRNTITRKDRMLKELKETRIRGYSVNNEEYILGRASIAAPVFGRGGLVNAAISLTGSPENVLGSELKQHTRHLLDTATEISRLMGHSLEAPWRMST